MRIVINDGTSFLISNEAGNSFGKESGLYYHDTRFLRKFKLLINGCSSVVLGTRNINHFSSLHYLTNLSSKDMDSNSITLKRSRFVGRGLHEDIDITNYLNKEIKFELTLEFDSDFADIFEVKKGSVRKRPVKSKIDHANNSLIFSYKAQNFLRKTIINFCKHDSKPFFEKNSIIFKIKIRPKKTWHTCVDISTTLTEKAKKPFHKCEGKGLYEQKFDKDIENYLKKAPFIETNNHILERTFGRAKRDLAALALRVDAGKESVLVPAAGIPWFVTLFGRDSIIAGLQSLILTPMFGKGALLALADRQGKVVNDFNKEQPGAIVHEVRFGELAIMREVPHALYYATIDATPLFLMLVGEYFNWTGDIKTVKKLEPNIEAALKWIDEYGDKDGDGYVEYLDKSISWKDSYDSIMFNDGRMAKPPMAVSEVQAYVYSAKLSIANIYRYQGKVELATKLEKQAADLKKRFNRDFWMEDKQFYALALDADKKQVDPINSNAGHLLFCGIVPKSKARVVVNGLMDKNMFSGWGIRTLSKQSKVYNPVSYHNGSVWPHDNAIIAAGLKRYGFNKEANKIIEGLIKASHYFDANRLPELFCGYERAQNSFPVDYPTSSSPQAWAASSVAYFLSMILGIKPKACENKVVLKPSLIEGMNYFGIHGINVGKSSFNIHIKRKDRKLLTDVQMTRGKKINFEII